MRAPRVANDGVLARLVPERVRAVANGEHSVIEVIHLPGALLIGYLEVLIDRFRDVNYYLKVLIDRLEMLIGYLKVLLGINALKFVINIPCRCSTARPHSSKSLGGAPPHSTSRSCRSGRRRRR